MSDQKNLRDEVALAVALDFLSDEVAVRAFSEQEGADEKSGIAKPLMKMAFIYADAFMEARGQ